MSTSFRNQKLELAVIAYELRKDYKACDIIERDYFSIKPYKIFHDVVNRTRTLLSRDMLVEIVGSKIVDVNLLKSYISKIYSFNLSKVTNNTIEQAVNKLRELYMLRFSSEKLEEMLTVLENKNIDEVRKLARSISLVGTSRKRVYAGDYIEDFKHRKNLIKERTKMDNVGILTGIKEFDRESGGILPGELGIVIGESGKGKSITLENFGIYPWLHQDKNVLYITVEMPKLQVQLRMDSNLTALKYSKFRKGDFTAREIIKWEKKIRELKDTKDNYFEIVSMPRGCSARDIEAEGERVQDIRGQRLDLIIVDYLNIMRTNNGKYSNSKMDWGNQVDIAHELTALAKDFSNGEQVAVWSANQLTDEAEGLHLVKKKHLKYARGILEAANIVMALLQDQDDVLEDIMRFQFLKLRDIVEMDPIIVRPNFDIMLINEERSFRSLKDVKRRRK